ncbi:hydrogenase nickel incorporation protein HypA/HybF [Candidatus Hakubella thermalkaliphila]|uniref:Hydrogenase maturation factor HypA n=2 Tax=Candidatus Hakubella thermalkaliphila TaxID=2754717 RepID=A0A6V8QC48_9ACTN|nr:hydrogenase maturation nickel metallochaperone HypA [Candidatus Hakubella thermalkaliphila]MBT9171285.1 Hydrogenase/urease nickel incorporation protein HypA [Actinomycetota bacterium]GFP21729.1 hydrogenase nickel incorporation protein HypA/HybF [Candidatus Hakubella thermalkaliphila]GFP42359.1 hydrogenase nickel incorporation protein HypA/HybF [Candidatus Hakubella thermalkaliphila]
MHEFSITQDMINVVVDQAKKSGARKVKRVSLALGELSSVTEESVNFYFQALSKGTIAEGAELIFRTVPATYRCHQCQEQFSGEEDRLTCPRCGGSQISLVEGNDILVESIEAEA